jgi:CheY-like chemotaxis protein
MRILHSYIPKYTAFPAMLSPASHLQNILIADDDDDDCLLFKDAFDELAVFARLTFASNGKDLLAILTNEALQLPDMIFLDLNMPLKNGIECLTEIKSDPRLKDIPLIICSTSAQQWALDTTYELKADKYIRKPEAFSKLKNAIHQVLSVDWAHKPGFTKDKFLVE